MKLATLPANFKLGFELRSTFRIHFAIFLRIPPIVSKCEISYYVYTDVSFKIFTIIVDQTENTAKMDSKMIILFIVYQYTYSNCNTAEPSSETSFEVSGQSRKFHSVNSFEVG